MILNIAKLRQLAVRALADPNALAELRKTIGQPEMVIALLDHYDVQIEKLQYEKAKALADQAPLFTMGDANGEA